MAPTKAHIAPKAVEKLPHVQMVNGQAQMAPEVAPKGRNLVFFYHFQSFFRLETPRNLK